MSEENPLLELSPDPMVGKVLGERYRITKRLGEGGMGVVYLSRHVVLDKPVALKILHEEYSRRPELVQRFLHEAKAASRVRHEHVVDVYDFGQLPDGNVFFAMEVLEGQDLANILKENGPLPWKRVKDIMLQLASALQTAHEAGVIHRDLKPENIFLTPRRGQPDFVKILDFGIAKLTEIEEGAKRLTRTGMVFGTPEYMSPEQARGERADQRVDVYASGCLMFELLMGIVPYNGDNFMGILTKHIFEPIPKLSDRTNRPDLPEGLQAVLEKALAKSRDERYPSMKAFATALEALDPTPGIVDETTTESVPRDTVEGALAEVRRATEYVSSDSLPPVPKRSSKKLVIGASVFALVGIGAFGLVVLNRDRTTSAAPTPDTETRPAPDPAAEPQGAKPEPTTVTPTPPPPIEAVAPVVEPPVETVAPVAPSPADTKTRDRDRKRDRKPDTATEPKTHETRPPDATTPPPPKDEKKPDFDPKLKPELKDPFAR